MHFDQIEWLGDKITGSCRQCAQFMVRLGGNHQDRQVAIRLDFLKFLHHLEAIHTRHLQIQQDQVIVVFLVQRAHFEWIGGGCQRNISGVAQQLSQHHHIGFLIIYNQDAGMQNFLFTNSHNFPISFTLTSFFSAAQYFRASPSAFINSSTLIGSVR